VITWIASAPSFLDRSIGESPFVVRQMLFAMLLPLIIGIVVGFPGSKKKQKTDDETQGMPKRDMFAARIPLALAGALALAFLMLEGMPDEQWHSLLWAGLAGAGFGVVLSFTPRHPLIRGFIVLVMSGAVTACIWPVIEREDMWVRAIAPAGVFVVACLMEPICVRRPGPATIFPIGIAIAASMATLVAIVSLTSPLPYLAVGLALFGVFLVSLLPGRTVSLGDGAVAVLAPMMVLFPYVIQFYLFADSNPWWLFALPTAALIGLWLPELPAIARKPRVAAALRIATVVAICAVAGGLTGKWINDQDAADSDDPYADMYSGMLEE